MVRFARAVGVAALLMLAWAPVRAAGELTVAPHSVCSGVLRPTDRLPMYEIRRLRATDVRQFRTYLAHECWALALQTFYSRFRPDLPDWVVHIDSAGTVHQGLIGGRTRAGAPQVFDGERYTWAVVFTDLPTRRVNGQSGTDLDTTRMAKPKAPAQRGTEQDASPEHPQAGHGFLGPPETGAKLEVGDTADLWLARRTIAYTRDPMITDVIKGLSRLIGVAPDADPAAPDSLWTIQLQQVSADSGKSMWVGYARFGFVNNAQIELSLSPVRTKEFPDPIAPPGRPVAPSVGHVFADFVNAKRPVVGANAYLAAVWNLPIQTPFHFSDPFWEQSQLGVFAGTNVLGGNVGGELVAGAPLGHLFGDAGLSVGSSWTQGQGLTNGVIITRYRARLLIASDPRF